MPDLTERLRRFGTYDEPQVRGILDEAADEIDRLREKYSEVVQVAAVARDSIEELDATVVSLTDRIRVLEEALREIESWREKTIFRQSGEAPEEFMDGANSAFIRAADTAKDALEQTDEG